MAAGSDPSGRHRRPARRPAGDALGPLPPPHSLDEIPNLVNVLRGEMAIVGRARLAAHVEHFSIAGHRRFDVLPGITGWPRCRAARHPLEERVELDAWYAEHRNAWLDLRILAKTLRLVITGQGLARLTLMLKTPDIEEFSAINTVGRVCVVADRPKVELRRFEPGDAPAIHRWFNNPEATNR